MAKTKAEKAEAKRIKSEEKAEAKRIKEQEKENVLAAKEKDPLKRIRHAVKQQYEMKGRPIDSVTQEIIDTLETLIK